MALAGAGVTLPNCLAAADQLGRDGIHARALDLYSIRPARHRRRPLPARGIGGAVLQALNDAGQSIQVAHLAVARAHHPHANPAFVFPEMQYNDYTPAN